MKLSVYVPGLLVSTAVAVSARLTHRVLLAHGFRPVGEILIAIVLGLALAPLALARPAWSAGTHLSSRNLLKLGIVLLGAGLSLERALVTGAAAAGIIVACIALALAVTTVAAGRLGIGRRLAALVGVGTAICGASAIVAVAPIIEADDDEVSYGIGVITIFGVLAIFTYPWLGRTLDLSDLQYAVWTGVGVHETAQVLAAGFAFSEEAGRLATVVKLTRTTMLVPLALVLALGRRRSRRGAAGAVPWFVLGFLACSGLRATGDALLQAAWWPRLVVGTAATARWLILTAMAGVGLNSRWQGFRRLGPNALGVGLLAAGAVGTLGLLLSRWLVP